MPKQSITYTHAQLKFRKESQLDCDWHICIINKRHGPKANQCKLSSYALFSQSYRMAKCNWEMNDKLCIYLFRIPQKNEQDVCSLAKKSEVRKCWICWKYIWKYHVLPYKNLHYDLVVRTGRCRQNTNLNKLSSSYMRDRRTAYKIYRFNWVGYASFYTFTHFMTKYR